MPILPSVNHPINCGLATTPQFARQFSKKLVANRSVDVFAIPSMRAIDSSIGVAPETIGDTNWLKETFQASVSDCEVSIVGFGVPWDIRSVKSLNTNILSNPSEANPLKLTYQSNGTTSIEVELVNGERFADGFTTYTQTASPIYTFQSHVDGSLAKHVYNQVSSLANGSTSSPNHYPIYSTFDFTNNIFVKNSGFWASSLDFSGVSVNKIGSGGVTGVVMVTPRHAIGAAHYAPPNDPNGGPIIGDKIYFVDNNNNTIERTVVAASNTLGDSRIVKFNSDVPSSIKKYRFLPSNWKNYLPIGRPSVILPTSGNQINYCGINIPIIVMSHYRWDESWPLQRPNRYAYVYSSLIQWAVYRNGGVVQAAIMGNPSNVSYFGGQFVDYNGEPSGIRGGDSGLPCFYLINGELIFLMKHLYPATGPFLSDYLTILQDTINSMGSEGHAIQTVNLSGFTDFSS